MAKKKKESTKPKAVDTESTPKEQKHPWLKNLKKVIDSHRGKSGEKEN